MAKKTVKKATKNNPTLHGLLVARTLSGTVVRTLLFIVLSGVLVLVATMNLQDGDTVGSLATLVAIDLVYLVFDLLYVLMATVRPFHPRIDRVVLPVALVFSLACLYAPMILISDAAVNVVNIWIAGAFALVFILGVRLALLIASTNR